MRHSCKNTYYSASKELHISNGIAISNMCVQTEDGVCRVHLFFNIEYSNGSGACLSGGLFLYGGRILNYYDQCLQVMKII